MDPWFIHSHKPQQKFVRNWLKKVQISTRHILSCMLLINCQKSGYPSDWEFSHMCRSSVRMEWTLSWEIPTAITMFLTATRLSPITISWTLITISGCHSDRPSRTGSSTLEFCHLAFYDSIGRGILPTPVLLRLSAWTAFEPPFSNFVHFAKVMCPVYFNMSPLRYKPAKWHGLLVT